MLVLAVGLKARENRRKPAWILAPTLVLDCHQIRARAAGIRFTTAPRTA
jgi:hypothetical protein